ncbi:putative aarF domain-containing protein kinase 2 [Rhinoderma darwinii]|uniref:putative aarF domain-containing protein kinase 2 n=1 Tax=Rhinoderma darwinii TaxID=43563 RepID=UPI003F671367
MSLAGSLRAGVSICTRICLCRRSRDLSKWRDLAFRRLRCTNVKTLSRIALWCWGVRYVTTTQCETLVYKEDPGPEILSFGPSFSPQKPPETLLRKIDFIIRIGVRSFILLCKFGPLLFVFPLTYLSASLNSLWLCLLLKATESSGPACIKLGQWASTRRDLFSEEFCVLFSKLHVKVAPHPWEYTELCLRRAFGKNYGHVLRFLSRDPVGSGCVAQVYKAYADLSVIHNLESQSLVESMERGSAYEAWEVPGLHGIFGRLKSRRQPNQSSPKDHNFVAKPLPSTRASPEDHLVPVAVKVLHPNLGQQVKMDLLIMKTWSNLLSLIPGFRWLSLTEIVEEFEKLMTQQIDLRFEARNLETFQQKFEKIDFIKFPTPLRPFVTRNILVETFEDGEPLSVYLQETGSSQIKHRIAAMGVDMLLKMIFVDNFVHADLHPGNILVQGVQELSPVHSDQTTLVDMCDTLIVDVRPSRCPLRLVLLDAGIVAELQEKDLENFRSVFTAVVLGQGETVAELILHHARANQCIDVESFKSQMAELVNEARKNTVSLGKLQVVALLSQVFRLLMTHKVKLESNFASIVFAILVLEGLGRSLDPEIDILEAAKPLLLKSAASLL